MLRAGRQLRLRIRARPGKRGLRRTVLLPTARDAATDAVILADGFSCRTQIHELDSGGREAMHLAELLAADQLSPEYPEHQAAPRPAPPNRMASLATVGAMAACAAAAVATAGTARR